jgi:hypothetical protein
MASRALTSAVLLGTVILAGCTEAWPKNAGSTTCAEWVDQMSPDQRGSLADAMLKNLWVADAAANEPAPAARTAFGNAIGPACTANRAVTLSRAAAEVYVSTPAVRP